MSHSLFAYQAVPPVQDGTPAQPSVPGDPAPPPGAADPPGLAAWFPLLVFIPLILLLFWQSRSQQKKQEAAIAALKKGDRVVTQSGLVGRLLEVDSRYAKVELSPGVKVTMLRSVLSGRDAEDSAKPAKQDEKK